MEQTNLYAQQTMSDDQYSKWEEVNAEEIWAYMGFMIFMGINHLPALSDYWKMDPTYCYSPIADRITRDCFFLKFPDICTLLTTPPPSSH